MDNNKMVIFNINGLEYGIPGEYVQSIEKMQPITRVPFTSTFIEGVFNLRGVIIPVLSLSTILGTKSQIPDIKQKIIIVRCGEIEAGLLIDKASDVLTISLNSIEPIDEKFDSSHLLSGVLKLDKRLISILDLERALFPDRKEE